MAGTIDAAAVGSARQRPKAGGAVTRRARRRCAGRTPHELEPTMDTAPASRTPTAAPDTVFIDELTWEETRDALKAGKTTVIVPTGGTEKNGYHMVARQAQLRRHLRRQPDGAPAQERAGRADDPVRARGRSGYVRVPGEISLPSPAYDMLLDAAARSLKVHGFTDILFIGDSGGNQAGIKSVADKLNEEWKGSAARRCSRLTDYYEASRAALSRVAAGRVRLRRPDRPAATPGSPTRRRCCSCGRPGFARIRSSRGAARQDSGVSGDPAKATAEIGKMGIEFKVNAAISQHKPLKNPPTRGRDAEQLTIYD